MNFAQRHIGPDEFSQHQMLTALGYASLDELTAAALPAGLAIARLLGDEALHARLTTSAAEIQARDGLTAAADMIEDAAA